MLPSSSNRGRTPAYDLEEVQRLVGQGPTTCKVTEAALLNADELRFSYADIIAAVLELKPANFHKTMLSTRIPGAWQDVYRSSYRGRDLYIKVQINPASLAVVIQFKKR